MIHSNLKRILKDNELSISHVAEKTGISRTTITSLAQNTGNGIQFDTLDKLCSFLMMDINDVFTFIPFDVNITFTENFSIDLLPLKENIKLELNSIIHDSDSFAFKLDTYFIQEDSQLIIVLSISEKYEYIYHWVIDKLSNNVISIIRDILADSVTKKIHNDLQDNMNIRVLFSNLHKWDKWDMYNLLNAKIEALEDRK